MPDYKFQHWIRFFRGRAQYRTLCIDCAEMIQDYHAKVRRRARQQSVSQGHYSQGQATWASRGNPSTTSPEPESNSPSPGLNLRAASELQERSEQADKLDALEEKQSQT